MPAGLRDFHRDASRLNFAKQLAAVLSVRNEPAKTSTPFGRVYLRSSSPSWESCSRPRQCPLWRPAPRERWWDRRCTSVPRCPRLHFGSGPFCAGSRCNAGPPGRDTGRPPLLGSRWLGPRLPSLLRGLERRPDSRTGSEVNVRLWGKETNEQ